MSEPLEPTPSDPGGLGPETRMTLLERYSVAQRAEGILAPVLTALLAFIVGGLIVLITTGKNPIDTYRAIFDGTGLNWLFPWVTGDERITATFRNPWAREVKDEGEPGPRINATLPGPVREANWNAVVAGDHVRWAFSHAEFARQSRIDFSVRYTPAPAS